MDGMIWVLPSSVIGGHRLHENADRGMRRLRSREILASLRGFAIEVSKDSGVSVGL